MRHPLALIVTMLTLSACANQGLQQVTSNSRGPDEFIIDPKAELSQPGSYTDLPPPTPGQGNRVDVDPQSEMITALGGRPESASAPVPGRDAALVTAASRLGVTPDVRATVAAEDAEFRRGQSRFTGLQLFPENLYQKVYRGQALDARSTAEAWRPSGAQLPTYPPAE